MKKKDKIIIIGGGISGLTAGYYSIINNYETEIFDCNKLAGGLLTKWQKHDFKFDGLVTYLYGHKVNSPFHGIFEELNISDPDLYIDLNEFNFFIPGLNSPFKISPDLNKIEHDLIAISPQNSHHIKALINDIHLMTLKDSVDPKFNNIKYMQTATDFFRKLNDDKLEFIFSNLFGDSLPLFSILWLFAKFIKNEMSYFKYGTFNIIEQILNKFIGVGGSFNSNKMVERIIVENNKAIGIKTSDNNIHFADKIICACDYYSIFNNLLKDSYNFNETDSLFEKWEIFEGNILISLGVNAEIKLPYLNCFLLEETFNVLGEDISTLLVKNFTKTNYYAPAQKSMIQISFHSDFENWIKLKKNPEKYEKEKKRIAQICIEKLTKYIPNIGSQIEVIDIATPYTFWHYSKNHKGAYCGWLPTIKNINKTIPVEVPDIESLFLAGQWLMPGGGVGSSLLTGKNSIETISQIDKKIFIHTTKSACNN